jgi:carboxypeptidase Q
MEGSTRTAHTNMDLYDHVLEDDLKQSTVIATSFVYNAAMRAEKLPRKPLR